MLMEKTGRNFNIFRRLIYSHIKVTGNENVLIIVRLMLEQLIQGCNLLNRF